MVDTFLTHAGKEVMHDEIFTKEQEFFFDFRVFGMIQSRA